MASAHSLISSVVDSIGDPHTRFLTPEIAQGMRSSGSSKASLGMLVSPIDRSVAMVFPSGPAALAGVNAGETVVRINGIDISLMAEEELVSLLGRVANEEPDGVVLSLDSRGYGPRSITVLPGRVARAWVPTARRLPGNIGYLELPAGSSDEMWVKYPQSAHDAMAELVRDGVVGWVIDLRRNWGGNPGGMLAAIGGFAGPGVIGGMVKKHHVVSWRYEDGRLMFGERLIASVDSGVVISEAVPVAVLISEVTASAAEAVGIALTGRPNVKVIGRRSYGMTTTTGTACLSDSAEIIIADGYMVDRLGRPYWDGLIPDVLAEIDWARIGSADDPTLALACRWIEGFDR